MAELDLSDAFGIELIDQFTVVRRRETVDSNGEAVIETDELDACGVVTRASPDDLVRLAEADLAESHITIVTQFQLRGPSRQNGTEQFKPDYVLWAGTTFIVKTVDPYGNFGSGFCQGVAGSVESIDQAPE